MDVKTNSQPLLARNIMAQHIHTVLPTCDISDGLRLMLMHHVSGIPLINEERHYVGMFSEKCCMRVLMRSLENLQEPWTRMPNAEALMTKRLYMLRPHDDVFEAIDRLLKQNFSGAPIADVDKSFIGVFSEKTSMSVLVEAAYANIPTAAVWAFANPDRGRIVSPATTLPEVVRLFIETPYRRLPVVKDAKIIGQISRRDVLNHPHVSSHLLSALTEQAEAPMPKQVLEVADIGAETIAPDMDLLAIAQRFLNTPYRRFPVLEDGRLIGQVSRRDVLRAALNLLTPKGEHHTGGLYLSAVDTPSRLHS